MKPFFRCAWAAAVAAASMGLSLTGADANTQDDRGVTPLVRAAALGSIAEMRALLDRGADPNLASKGGATPLLAALGDAAKVKLLLEKGADVNATTSRGGPVTIASRLPGTEVVRLLLEKGAKVPGSAVRVAISRADEPLARDLIAAGGTVEAALLGPAAASGNPELVRMVLEKQPQAAREVATVGSRRTTPLMLASFFGPAESVRLLLAGGAPVALVDGRSRTALMYAVGGDFADPSIVRQLLDKGADRNAKDEIGETALDKAMYRGKVDVIRAMGGEPVAKPASRVPEGQPGPLADRLRKAVDLLDAAGPVFFKANGCISCHNQSIPQMAAAAIRAHGLKPGEKAAQDHARAVIATWTPHRDALWQNDCSGIGGLVATMSYGLAGLAAAGHERSETVELVAACLSRLQQKDGRWMMIDARHPLGSSAPKFTALTLRGIRAYAPAGLNAEMADRIGRGVRFLETAAENDNQGLVFRILGLRWADANPALRKELAQRLKKRQRADGGWSQQPEMSSDAYATGQVLWALSEAGSGPGDKAYDRGARWLRAMQKPDGSWHVKSRGYGFQPYRETGFPYGHDQWLSAAATGFSVLGLAPMLGR